MKSTIKKIIKTVLLVLLGLVVLFGAYVGYIIYRDSHPEAETSTTQSAADTAMQSTKPAESEYTDTPVYRESEKTAAAATEIAVQLTDDAKAQLLSAINDGTSPFRFASFYALDEALALYKSSPVSKSTQSSLLTDGRLDAGKLYQTVLANNDALMNGEKSMVNAFYEELEADTIQQICNEIVKVINDTCSDESIAATANTLQRLTVFKRTGSASNAYINSSISFIVNPTMIGMYQNMQDIADPHTETAWLQTIDHEIMHLIQHGANDGDDTNGVEIGFSRMFNNPGENKKLPVDTLYWSWLLDAGAELSMARYLNIDPGTYAKKISYAVSHNLSRFYEIDSSEKLLEAMCFLPSPDAAFSSMGIENENDQNEFFKFMYSVEVTQTEPDDLWDYYTAQTGRNPSEDEKTGMRMDIRTDAVQYMTKSFFTNLTHAVADGAIRDLDSVFFMLRLWEIDTFKHLNYNELASLEHADAFVLYYDRLQTSFLTALAESSSLDAQQLMSSYADYCLRLQTADGTIKDNCDLPGLSSFMQTYIAAEKENYIYTKYSLLHDVAATLQ